MPSQALLYWRTGARLALDEVESAHAAIGGTGRGRRYATGQVDNAYVVLLSSQFQRFCRDLHTEAAAHLSAQAPAALAPIIFTRLTEGRKLDSGNPNRGNLGSDYGRFGMVFWDDPRWTQPAAARRRTALESMNEWRNAIAHQDFSKPACGGRTVVQLAQVRRWRRACDRLAVAFDGVIGHRLVQVTGTVPW